MRTVSRQNRKVRTPALAAPRRITAALRLPSRPRLTTTPEIAPKAQITKPAATSEPAPVRQEPAHGDTLQLYLREIGQVKLLTPQEEIVLAKKVQKGDEQAREQMIKANLRLVVKIARDYEGQGLPLLDLINEGNIGLMKGVERFDPTKGAKLSTYVSLWIKQSIRRALSNQSKTIRLPDHVIDKLSSIRKAEMKLREILDREPTDEELANQIGLTPRRVQIYREASRSTVSLDAPIGSDDQSDQVSEIVADPNAAAPFDDLVKSTDTELVKEVFSFLNDRERAILAMRFGLKDDNQKTLEEVGKHFGVTRERIRQIEAEALKKLRAKMEQRDRRPVEPLFASAQLDK
jgi:RNA polymerase primary sigma factor